MRFSEGGYAHLRYIIGLVFFGGPRILGGLGGPPSFFANNLGGAKLIIRFFLKIIKGILRGFWGVPKYNFWDPQKFVPQAKILKIIKGKF